MYVLSGVDARGLWDCQAAPNWCAWMPFADYFADCRVPTPAEIEACQRREFGPQMPPARIEEAIRLGTELTDAYCRMHPDECQEYQTAVAGDWPAWLLWAAVAVGTVAALSAIRR